jgi:hypothetical protein
MVRIVEHILATGGPNLATSPGRFDLGPLLMLVATLSALRFLFRITMTGPVIGIGVLAGLALGLAVTVWGVLTPSAIALLVATVVSAPIRRHQAGGAAEA